MFVWIFRWWWSGCCSHYFCLRMWWATICRCRVSDHPGTDPYATFVVMSTLSERCHLVFTEASGKVGVYVLPLRCVFRDKKWTFSTPIRDRASAVVFFVSFLAIAYTFVVSGCLFVCFLIRNVKKPSAFYGVGLGCGLGRRKRRWKQLLQPQKLKILHDLAQYTDHKFLVF